MKWVRLFRGMYQGGESAGREYARRIKTVVAVMRAAERPVTPVRS